MITVILRREYSITPWCRYGLRYGYLHRNDTIDYSGRCSWKRVATHWRFSIKDAATVIYLEQQLAELFDIESEISNIDLANVVDYAVGKTT